MEISVRVKANPSPPPCANNETSSITNDQCELLFSLLIEIETVSRSV